MWSALFKEFLVRIFYVGLFCAVFFLIVRLLKLLSYPELLIFSAITTIIIIGLLLQKRNT